MVSCALGLGNWVWCPALMERDDETRHQRALVNGYNDIDRKSEEDERVSRWSCANMRTRPCNGISETIEGREDTSEATLTASAAPS